MKKQIKEKFPHIICHELNHCKRWQTRGKEKNLLNAIIRDGLADQFAEEVTGIEPQPWSIAFEGEELQQILEKAEKEFNNNDYDHGKWFFSRGKGGVPHWTGYTLGHYLVGEYLKKHPDKKPSTLYDVPATEFV